MSWEIIKSILLIHLIGLLAGFAIGYSFKKLSKLVVFIIGIILIAGLIAFLNHSFPSDWNFLSTIRNQLVLDIDFFLIPSLFLSNILLVVSGIIGFYYGFKKG